MLWLKGKQSVETGQTHCFENSGHKIDHLTVIEDDDYAYLNLGSAKKRDRSYSSISGSDSSG